MKWHSIRREEVIWDWETDPRKIAGLYCLLIPKNDLEPLHIFLTLFIYCIIYISLRNFAVVHNLQCISKHYLRTLCHISLLFNLRWATTLKYATLIFCMALLIFIFDRSDPVDSYPSRKFFFGNDLCSFAVLHPGQNARKILQSVIFLLIDFQTLSYSIRHLLSNQKSPCWQFAGQRAPN